MKKLIRNIIGLFGYDFIKIPKTRLFRKEFVLKMGDYQLVIPSVNPLLYTYQTQKDFATELTRIAKPVYSKYPSSYFVDIGANIGDTMTRLKSIDGKLNIICVEGDAFSFSYLKRNSVQFDNVYLFNNFLGEKDQLLSATMDKAGWNNTIIPSEEGSEKLSLITFDTLIEKEFKKEITVKFLKIDTEGFDTIILRGASRFLVKYKPVIYFEYNRDNMTKINEDGLATLFNLKKYGYSRALFFDDRGRYILNTKLSNTDLITQLHNYADGKNALIYYYNICVIHEEDENIAEGLILNEYS